MRRTHHVLRPALVALVGLVAPVGLTACGDDGASSPDAGVADAAIDAVPREVIMLTQPFGVGEIIEGIMTGGPGDYAQIELTAPVAKLSWNIHGHANGGTQVVDEAFDQMEVDFTFLPPAEADWYLLLRNDHTTNIDVEVRIALFGDMTWRWQ